MRDGSVVDQNIDAPLFFRNACHKSRIRVVVGNIQPTAEGLAPDLANAVACGIDMRASVDAVNHGPLSGKLARDRCANSLRGACDQCDLSIQFHACPPLDGLSATVIMTAPASVIPPPTR